MIAVVFFVADVVKVAFLIDFIPFVNDQWKPTISLVSLVIGVSLYKMNKQKTKTN